MTTPIDQASIDAWRERDDHDINRSFDVKVARWKIDAVYEATPIRHNPCYDRGCIRHGSCVGHAEVPVEVIDPPRLQHADWHEAYADELVGCPAFAWRFTKSLAEVWKWARITERERIAVDLWLDGENRKTVARAVHASERDVPTILDGAFTAIKERVRASSEQVGDGELQGAA